MISDKMQERLNEQLQAELDSAYLYLSMSAYCSSAGLRGVAHWMRIQWQEEVDHALKFFDYIDQQGRVRLLALGQPVADFKSVTDVFEKTLAHEQKVTKRINDLVGAARDENDHATEVFLQWFVTEQIEEEAAVVEILDKLKLVGDSGPGLFQVDQELGGRQEPAV